MMKNSILLVQANECLYSKNSPGYRNPEKKKIIWKQNSIEMDYPEELCQKRWSCVRDRYAKEKHQENLPSGSGANYASQLPLMQSMEFIAPYIVPRPMRCSYNIFKESGDSQSSVLLNLHCQCIPPSLCRHRYQVLNRCRKHYQMHLSGQFYLHQLHTSPMAKRKKQAESTEYQNFSKSLDAFTKICESSMENQKEEDSLTGFGQMIVSTIRSMSQTKHKVALQRVTSLIMEMSLEPYN